MRRYRESGAEEVRAILLSKSWYRGTTDPEYFMATDYIQELEHIERLQREQGISDNELPSFTDTPRVPQKVSDVIHAISATVISDYLALHREFPNSRTIRSYQIEEALRIAGSRDRSNGIDFGLIRGGFSLTKQQRTGARFGLPDTFVVDGNDRLLAVDYATAVWDINQAANNERLEMIQDTFRHPKASKIMREALGLIDPNLKVDESGLNPDQLVLVAMNRPYENSLRAGSDRLKYGAVVPCLPGVSGEMIIEAIQDLTS